MEIGILVKSMHYKQNVIDELALRCCNQTLKVKFGAPVKQIKLFPTVLADENSEIRIKQVTKKH